MSEEEDATEFFAKQGYTVKKPSTEKPIAKDEIDWGNFDKEDTNASVENFNPQCAMSFYTYVQSQYSDFQAKSNCRAQQTVTKEKAQRYTYVIGEFGNGVQRMGNSIITYIKGMRQEKPVMYTLEAWTAMINDALQRECALAVQVQRPLNVTFR